MSAQCPSFKKRVATMHDDFEGDECENQLVEPEDTEKLYNIDYDLGGVLEDDDSHNEP